MMFLDKSVLNISRSLENIFDIFPLLKKAVGHAFSDKLTAEKLGIKGT